MRLIPSDPDVETIISRIRQGEIKLQPDFQRGEVWSDAKKRRLVDTILRNWHVPPVHVVDVPSGIPEVLDGQQRLVAIRDFANGVVKIDGRIEPHDPDIAKLDGLTYEQLPPDWKRRINRFSIRFFNITDYSPDEPAELFFRLNQPVALTSSEQRNAFFGATRSQIKELVDLLHTMDVDRDFLGFSNSRMAYDDVLARFCSHLQIGSLKAKVTSGTLASLYRSKAGFSSSVITRAHSALEVFAASRPYIGLDIRFNKATLFSWLWFTAASQSLLTRPLEPNELGDYLAFFDRCRVGLVSEEEKLEVDGNTISRDKCQIFISTYEDRSSSRVADVTSVLARDATIWIFFCAFARLLDLNIVPTLLSERAGHLVRTTGGRSEDFIESIATHAWDTRL